MTFPYDIALHVFTQNKRKRLLIPLNRSIQVARIYIERVKMSSSARPPQKRYRREEDEKKKKTVDSDDDNYVPYVSVRERKKNELLRLGRLINDHGGNSSSDNESDEEQSQEMLGRKYK